MNKETKIEATKPGEQYGWIAFTVFFIGMAFLLFTKRDIPLGENDFDFSFLLIPFILPLFATLIKQILPIVFKGTFVKSLGDIILLISIGIALFTLISNPPTPSKYHGTGYFILLLALMPILYKLALFFLSKQPALLVFLRSMIFFLSGLILRFSLLQLTWGELIELELGEGLLKIPLADIIFWSFTFTSLSILLALLSVVKNIFLAHTGRYFGLSPVSKFLFYLTVLTYFISFRPYFNALFPLIFMVIEWIILVAVCLLLIYSISKQTRSFIKTADYAQWKKHKQKIEIDTGDELTELAAYITDFVEENDKKSFLIYIIGEALQQQLSMNQIKEIINDLIDYTSEPTPKLITPIKYRASEEKNQIQRRIVLENTIEKFKLREAK